MRRCRVSCFHMPDLLHARKVTWWQGYEPYRWFSLVPEHIFPSVLLLTGVGICEHPTLCAPTGMAIQPSEWKERSLFPSTCGTIQTVCCEVWRQALSRLLAFESSPRAFFHPPSLCFFPPFTCAICSLRLSSPAWYCVTTSTTNFIIHSKVSLTRLTSTQDGITTSQWRGAALGLP